MSPFSRTTVVHSSLAFAVPIIAIAWFAVGGSSVTTTSVLTVAALLTALVWVASVIYRNGQPAPGMAQIIYETEHGGSTPPRGGK